MALDTRIELSLIATLTAGLDLSAIATLPLSYPRVCRWPSGTAEDQADLLWHDQRTLAASASETLDLAGGLTNAFGATLTFARVKLMVVAAADGNTNAVQVGGAASNAFVNWVANSSDVVNVMPDGQLWLIAPKAGYAVTAGTGDQLKIGNSAGGTPVTYDIVIIGASA